VEATLVSSLSELIRCSQSNSEIHAYSDKAYVNDGIYIGSHTHLFSIWTNPVSIVNEEILDEKLKPHFQDEANGQEEGHCA